MVPLWLSQGTTAIVVSLIGFMIFLWYIPVRDKKVRFHQDKITRRIVQDKHEIEKKQIGQLLECSTSRQYHLHIYLEDDLEDQENANKIVEKLKSLEKAGESCLS